jgi:hypothetical protein
VTTSDGGDPSTDRPGEAKGPHDRALLGELETIQALLSEAAPVQRPGAPAAAPHCAADADADADIPLLDDPVEPPTGTPHGECDFEQFLEEELAREIGAELDEALDQRAFERGTARIGSIDVPVLTDVTAESDATAGPDFTAPAAAQRTGTEPGELDDALMRALMNDDWRIAAEPLLAAARRLPRTVATDALRTRLRSEIDAWLQETLQSRIADLRRRLLAAIDDELTNLTHAQEDSRRDADEYR